MSDKYGYIGIETLLNFCSNNKDHCVTPNDFMRMKRIKIDDRPHGKWIVHDRPSLQYGCNICGNLISINSNFCPNCGAAMRTKESKSKKPCPCDTCGCMIDRTGCQMDLCSDYQKWKEGNIDG